MDDISIRVRLQNARKAAAEGRMVKDSVSGIGDASGRASVKTDRLSKSSGKSRRGLMLMSGAAKTGGLALTAGLAVGAKHALSAFQDSRKEVAQTNAVLKSTKGAANVSGKEIDALTASLMRKTAVDDEQIRKGANMLLTFTNIRNEAGRGNKIFNKATATVTDMAAALGQDSAKSAVMLGKALNDPIKGVTALQKVGVAFTDDQKKQIKTLVDSGKGLKAQKIILAELNKEFGGSAAARATPLDHLNVALGELSETAGGLLAPGVDKGARALTKFLTQAQAGTGQGGRFVAKMKQMYTEGRPVARTFISAAVAVAKFTAKHPELAKVAVALVGVGVAIKALKFANSVTQFSSLVRGARAAPGRIRSALTSVRGIVSRIMGGAGSSGGRLLASNAATTAGANVGPQMNRKRTRFATAGRSMGGTAGRAAGTTMATQTSAVAGTSLIGASGRSGRLGRAFFSAGRLAGSVFGTAAAALVIGKIEQSLTDKYGGGKTGDKAMGRPGSYGNPFGSDGILGGLLGQATGGTVKQGGASVVGERGPEVLRNVSGKVHVNPIAKPIAMSSGGAAGLDGQPVYLVLDDGTTLTGHIARKVARKRARA